MAPKPYEPSPHLDRLGEAAEKPNSRITFQEPVPPLVDLYPILRYFHYEHLPPHLRAISRPYCELACSMVRLLPRNAETSTMLRKLLEAKDCAVRAQVGDGDHPAPKEAL